MRYRHNRGYRYRLTNPPQVILNARLDNIQRAGKRLKKHSGMLAKL